MWILLCISALVTSVHGYKVLVLVPMNGKSHWNYMKVFVQEFLSRGHEVTCITSISMGDHISDNYTEILIDPPLNIEGFSEY